jgi:hypothetical protein
MLLGHIESDAQAVYGQQFTARLSDRADGRAAT